MGLTQSPSMESFLAALLGEGRISDLEYKNAISLMQQDKQRPRTTRIPGAITVTYSALPSNQLAATSAVFNTVELIEQIFGYLDAKALVGAVSLTCRGFRNIVSTTPALRRKLYLQEDRTAARMQTPAIRNVHYTMTNRYVQILVVDAGKVLSKFSAVREMLLTQPPPRAAQIFYDCACRSRDAGNAVNEQGLRFGDVSRLLDEHFKSSQIAQTSFRPCHCEDFKEARIIVKSDQYLSWLDQPPT